MKALKEGSEWLGLFWEILNSIVSKSEVQGSVEDYEMIILGKHMIKMTVNHQFLVGMMSPTGQKTNQPNNNKLS